MLKRIQLLCNLIKDYWGLLIWNVIYEKNEYLVIGGNNMPLVSMKEMLNKAKAENYAVGQFNINNLEFTQAILQQLKKKNHQLFLVFLKVQDVIWVALKQLL